jgi:hypothetical protein
MVDVYKSLADADPIDDRRTRGKISTFRRSFFGFCFFVFFLILHQGFGSSTRMGRRRRGLSSNQPTIVDRAVLSLMLVFWGGFSYLDREEEA